MTDNYHGVEHGPTVALFLGTGITYIGRLVKKSVQRACTG